MNKNQANWRGFVPKYLLLQQGDRAQIFSQNIEKFIVRSVCKNYLLLVCRFRFDSIVLQKQVFDISL